MARPITTSYSEEEKHLIIEHVLAECASGRAVSRILAEDEGMPAASCFWRWHYADEALQENLARAREHGATVHLDEAIKIADTPQVGEVVTVERDPDHQKGLDDGGSVETLDGDPYEGMVVKVRKEDMLGHRKLQIETRIKVAQMIAPRKYGPKLDLTSGGEKLTLAAEIEAARRRVAEGDSEGH